MYTTLTLQYDYNVNNKIHYWKKQEGVYTMQDKVRNLLAAQSDPT